MGILSVSQGLADVIFKEKLLGKSGLGAHPGGDGHVVLRSVGVGLCGELQTCLAAGLAVGLELGNHCGIVFRVDDDRDALPVLGGAAHHRRTSDVDVLNGIFHGNIRLGDSLTERIEVDADNVDGTNAVFLQLSHVIRNIPAGKKRPVDLRVEGLDPAVADLRETGHVADTRDGKARLFQHSHGSAGGKKFPPQRHKLAGEFHHASLVANTD